MRPIIAIIASQFLALFATPAFSRDVEIALVVKRDKESLETPSYFPLNAKAVHLAFDQRKGELARAGIKAQLKTHYASDEIISYFEISKDILKSKAIAVVGFQPSRGALLAGKALESSDLMVISTYATSTELLRYKNNILQYAGTNRAISGAVSRYLEKMVPKGNILAVPAWDNEYSRNFVENLSKSVKNRLYVEKIIESQSNFDSVIKKVKSLDPSVVLVPNYPHISGSIIRAVSESGYRGLFVGGETWGEGVDRRFLNIVRDSTFKGITIRKFSGRAKNPKIERFSKALKIQGDITPVPPMLFYDSANLLIDSLIEIGEKNLSRKSVAELLRNKKEHTGLVGTTCFGNDGCTNSTFWVIEVDSQGFAAGKKLDEVISK